MLLVSYLLFSVPLYAQDTIKKGSVPLKLMIDRTTKNKNQITIINGDTLNVYTLPDVKISEPRVFKNKRDEKKYWRMVRNVKIALPYAKIAKDKLVNYEAQLDGKQNGAKKRIMKQVEQDLLAEYGDELKGLTITQGRILLKLIDRETGHTSYELVESLRGWFSANFWQGIAVLFDASLKSDFNPKENADDAMIDEIVVKIENGEL